MAAANSTGRVPTAFCVSCGGPRLGVNPGRGKLCRTCTARAGSRAAAATARMGPYISAHPLYPLWNSLMSRCNYEKHTVYRYYGGRGIYVCDEWSAGAGPFIAWALANGFAPGLDLDRIDNDGPYAPWNCQFITHKANVRKKKSTQCTEATARAIKKELASGRSITNVAKAHGFAFSLVFAIKAGKSWADV